MPVATVTDAELDEPRHAGRRPGVGKSLRVDQVVAEAFGEAQRGRAIGTLLAVNGVGLATGPLLGGLIVAGAGWRWVFLVNVPLVLLALVACAVGVAASRPQQDAERLDAAGVALLTAALFGIVFSLTFGDALGWFAPPILGTGALGVLALVAFVRVQRRRAAPTSLSTQDGPSGFGGRGGQLMGEVVSS